MTAPAAAPVVELEEVVVLVGGFPALAGASLSLQAAEIVGIRGPNGAGKSTLLRLCAGLLPLSRGRGAVLGHDLATRHGRRNTRRSIGLLGHSTALYDDLTVAENVRFWTPGARPDDVAEALEHLGLAGRLADVSVAGLSAGQRRRTAIAILMARRPRLWLLDEPHSGLDSAGRDILDNLIRSAAGSGATVLIATHDRGRIDDILTGTVHVHGGALGELHSDGAGSEVPR